MAKASNKKSQNTDMIITLKPTEMVSAILHMMNVNIQDVRAGEKRKGIFIWGPPGIAKSAIIANIAKTTGLSDSGVLTTYATANDVPVNDRFEMIDIRLSQLEPTDLRGIPVPVTIDGKTNVTWAIPSSYPTGNKKAILFFDELPNGAPSVQAACYQIVLDGKLGEYTLPDNTIVIAAGNRETDRGASFKMPTPLMNRFVHLEMAVDFEDWCDYAIDYGYRPEIIGFLTTFKDKLFNFDPTSASRGFATPRSWEAVNSILKNNPSVTDNVLRAMVAGCIGTGYAFEFMEYKNIASRLPDPSKIITGEITELKEGMVDDVSVLYTLVVSLCYEINEYHKKSKLNNTLEKFKRDSNNVFEFFLRSENKGTIQPEYIILFFKMILTKYDVKDVVNMDDDSSFKKLIKKYSSSINARRA
jgi:hypothetical protein